MNRKIFYDQIRPHLNLTTQNVAGMEKHLDYIERTGLPVDVASYGIATSWWESAQTMHPVKEAYWKSEEWRKRNLRYYPWYGRGLVQTTWQENYVKLAKLLGLPADTFTKNPEKLLTFEYALPALFKAMEAGIYTGKDFDDFLDGIDESDEEDFKEYKAARKIVNGTDRDDEIAKIALVIERGLRAAGYGSNQPPKPHVDPKLPAPKTWWQQMVKDWFS